MNFEIIKVPAEILRKKCNPVKEEDFERCENIAVIMFRLMEENKGAGLAAPQIGLNMRFFVLKSHDKKYVFINPEILEVGERMTTEEEGCLSIPGFHAKIERPHKIKFRAFQPNGIRITTTYEGWTARVFQHELDHLNGVLITDYVKQLPRTIE